MTGLQRLYQQRLTGTPLARPEDVVAWLGAVQAQEYPGGKWALSMRTPHLTDAVIDAACNEGRILRTHIMRPTWHFVTPEDIRWLMALTAPRVLAASAHMYRKLELDETTLRQSNAVIVRALEQEHVLTRVELGARLEAVGISIEGLRLTFMMFRAELDALICSGPMRGKQFTYALLDERAPKGPELPRDEALAELARRYFSSHGPATLRDFAWWSGLTLGDAKSGVTRAALKCEEIDGQTYWFSEWLAPVGAAPQTAYLLPTYDEFLVGYADFDKSRRGGEAETGRLVFDSTIMIAGRIVGSWRRILKSKSVSIELAPFRPLADSEQVAVLAAVDRYREFLGIAQPAEIRFVAAR